MVLVPLSSCACAILVLFCRIHGLDVQCASLVQSNFLGAQKGHSLKSPSFPVACDIENCFSTNRMHWNDLKGCMKKCYCFRCHFEVSILTHFGIFCCFRTLYTYTPYFGYNKFDWLMLIFYVQIEHVGYGFESSSGDLPESWYQINSPLKSSIDIH